MSSATRNMSPDQEHSGDEDIPANRLPERILVGGTDHAPISPSGLPALKGCPGRIVCIEGGALFPKQDNSEPAVWGSRAHALAEACMTPPEGYKWVDPIMMYHKVMVQYAHNYPEQYSPLPDEPLDTEMISLVEGYMSFCKNLITSKSCEYYVEAPLTITAECWGTGDFICCDYDRGILHVADLKTGVVDVLPTSEQLKAYGLGALKKFDPEGFFFQEVHLHIYQPRSKAGGPAAKVHKISVEDLYQWEVSFLKPLITEVYDALESANTDIESLVENTNWPDKTFLWPNEKSCVWCPGKKEGTCPALAELAIEAAVMEFSDQPEDAITGDAFTVLQNAKTIIDFVEALKAKAKDILSNGGHVPGKKLVAGRKSKAWRDLDATEAWLKAKKFKQDEMYNSELITPAKAIKLVKGRRFADQLDELYVIKPGKPTMVDEDDPRPALTQNGEEFLEEIQTQTTPDSLDDLM